MTTAYETIVGLEVHARLLTLSKLFSSESAAYGNDPNTAVSAVSLAHPGTLPRINKKAIELALKTGLACHAEIEKNNYFVRKNYFYPDLPKGYQVTQHSTPICKGGYIKIKTAGMEKKIRLNRIHIEEDAGKSLHGPDAADTLVDFNRAGTALIEIVTEPDIRHAEEAFVFISEVRKLLRYLDVCDGNMEEGSLRCDVNISVRKKGQPGMGTKVEIKNLNSVRNVKKAIEAESERLINMLEKGETIVQQTRSFDDVTGTTFSVREKEEADDYRYFPEPDLAPFHLQDDFIESVKQKIPELPAERIRRYLSAFGLAEYDASVLTEDKSISDYFEKLIAALPASHRHTRQAMTKSAANWMMGPVKSWLNENNKEINAFPLLPEKIAALIELVESGKVNFSIAASRIFPALLAQPDKDPRRLAAEMNLMQQSDRSFLEPLVEEILKKYPDKVKEFKKGKKGLISMFVGEVIKASKGQADPRLVNSLLKEKLQS